MAYNDHYFREGSGLAYLRGDVFVSTNLTKNISLGTGLVGILSLDEPFKDQLLYKIRIGMRF